MSDAALVQELLAQRSFVRALARRLARDEHVAQDVEQETLRAALASPPRLARELRPWLATLARNAARRMGRADARRTERELQAARAEAQPSTDELVARTQTMQRAVEAVLALPARQREVVLLRFYEGLSVRAVAERSGESVEAIKSRTRRALSALRRELDGEQGSARGTWLAALLPAPIASGVTTTTVGTIMIGRSAAVVAAALAIGFGAWRWSGSAVEPPAPVEAARSEAQGLPKLAVGPGRTPLAQASRESAVAAGLALAADDEGAILRGRVVDRMGQPFVGVRIGVGAEQDPFGDEGAPLARFGQYSGRQFETGPEGWFEARLPHAQRVAVAPMYSPRFVYDLGAQTERWIDAPADDLEIVIGRQPTAVLRVRVVDDAGERVESFRATARTGKRGTYSGGTDEGVMQWELPVLDPVSLTVTVELTRPATPEPVTGTWHLVAGERREFELLLGSSGALEGQVVDRAGLPLADALVWYGLVSDGRGDEPFQPFDPARIVGARSGTDGRFRLRGGGRLVSAWHERYGTFTGEPGDAAQIVLPPRGALEGILRDAAGDPLAGIELSVDRQLAGHTGDDGRFRIDEVEPGMRGLTLGDGRHFAVDVRAGGVCRLELDPGIAEFRLEFTRAGVAVARHEHAVLIGMEAPWAVAFLKPDSESQAGVARGLAPGPYLYLAADGALAHCELSTGHAVVELGTAELVVRANASLEFGIAPVESDPFVRLIAARLGGRTDANGQRHLGPLAPGAYDLLGHAGRVLERVQVSAPSTTFELSAR